MSHLYGSLECSTVILTGICTLHMHRATGASSSLLAALSDAVCGRDKVNATYATVNMKATLYSLSHLSRRHVTGEPERLTNGKAAKSANHPSSSFSFSSHWWNVRVLNNRFHMRLFSSLLGMSLTDGPNAMALAGMKKCMHK